MDRPGFSPAKRVGLKSDLQGEMMKVFVVSALALLLAAPAVADEAAARRWIDQEFQPSTLTKEQQLAELKWFIGAAGQLKAKGIKEISVVSETITTHEY